MHHIGVTFGQIYRAFTKQTLARNEASRSHYLAFITRISCSEYVKPLVVATEHVPTAVAILLMLRQGWEIPTYSLRLSPAYTRRNETNPAA